MRSFALSSPPRSSGFTLTELLVVVAISASMLGLALPAWRSIAQQSGRKTAVNEVLAVFEQARSIALTRGLNTHIVLADNNSAFGDDSNLNNNARYRAYRIFIDTDDDLCEPVTKWLYLPKRVSFKSETESLVGPVGKNPNRFHQIDYFGQKVDNLPGITFAPTGAVIAPTQRSVLKLLIYEGFHRSTGDTFTQAANQGGNTGFFEILTLSRFTGRIHADVQSLAVARSLP